MFVVGMCGVRVRLLYEGCKSNVLEYAMVCPSRGLVFVRA